MGNRFLYILLFVSSISLGQRQLVNVQRLVSTKFNTPEEKAYFDAYVAVVDSAAFLQTILDRENHVRLEYGDYTSAGNLTISDGQKLYGYPSTTHMEITMTVEAGSSDIHLQDFNFDNLVFEAGATIKNSTFKTIRSTDIECTGCSLENNFFLDIDKCKMSLDHSSTGYSRNNRIIKFWSHSRNPQIYFRGNDATPSYGNTFLWSNLLFSQQDGADIDNVDNWYMVGVEAETWNQGGNSDLALITINNVEDVRIGTLSGIHVTLPDPTPSYDIGADSFMLLNKTLYSRAGLDTIHDNSDRMVIGGKLLEDYTVEDSPGSFELRTYFGDSLVNINGASKTTALTGSDSTSLHNQIFRAKRRQWPKPTFDRLSDITGPNWATNRNGKPDSAAYIQGLVDSNTIAELGEGIYYIGSTITLNENEGIIGKGSGKTAIVGLTDDFPLITVYEDTSSERKTSVVTTLAYLTLQGGETGLYCHHDGSEYFQLSSCQWNNVIFRDQTNGIHLDQFYGIDNILIDTYAFVDCVNGLYQEPNPTYNTGMGETEDMMYIDKVVFYRNQFIGCDVGYNGLARRPSNLVSWIDTLFDGNVLAIDTQNHLSGLVANCQFTNNTGEYVIGRISAISIYNTDFVGNTADDLIKLSVPYVEGSNLLDGINIFADRPTKNYILNSTVHGGLGDFDYGLLMNTKIKGDASLSKPLIKFDAGVPTTILDGKTDPYPQFLVR